MSISRPHTTHLISSPRSWFFDVIQQAIIYEKYIVQPQNERLC